MLDDDIGLVNETATAMRELASTVTGAPPLRLSPRPGTAPSRRRPPRRWHLWAMPLAAAAVVVALALMLAAVRNHTPHATPLVTKPALTVDGVPRYYAALVQAGGNDSNPDQVQIRETLTGKLVATVNPPAGTTFAGITGAADDHTFVVDTQPGLLEGPGSIENQAIHPRTWYLLRFDPGTPKPTSLTRLPVPVTPSGTSVNGMAISPDGSMLAVAFEQPGRLINPTGKVNLRIFSVRTGAVLRTWTGTATANRELVVGSGGGQADGDLSLAWVDHGASLAFGVLTRASSVPVSAEIRELPVDAPAGTSLLAAHVAFTLAVPSRTKGPSALRCGVATASDLLFTGDGQLICGGTGAYRSPGELNAQLCATGPAWYLLGMLEYSPAPAGPIRVLRQYATNCRGPLTTVEPEWTNPAGTIQLGLLGVRPGGTDANPEFGIFQNGTFTPLPEPVSGAHATAGDSSLDFIAW